MKAEIFPNIKEVPLHIVGKETYRGPVAHGHLIWGWALELLEKMSVSVVKLSEHGEAQNLSISPHTLLN